MKKKENPSEDLTKKDDINDDNDILDNIDNEMVDESDEIDVEVQADVDVEVQAEDVDDDIDSDTVYFKFNTTSHKLEGKHRLKRDTIFYGKPNEEEEDKYRSTTGEYFNKDFPIEKGTTFDMESSNYEEMENQRMLKNDIYNLLSSNTDLDFRSNRRKPNKQAFNNYYKMLIDNLNSKYTKSEIFVELSYYFTDHIFNMYKLLYPEYATGILMELRDKGYLKELDSMSFI